MDFKKIEWIFFLAFLGLNIFLFSIFHTAKNEESNVTASNQKIDILQRLQSDDITYEGQLEETQPEGYYLSAEVTDMSEVIQAERKKRNDNNFLSFGASYDGHQLIKVPRGNFYISHDKNTKASVTSFLQQPDQVFYGTEYGYLPHLSLKDKDYPTIVAAQSYEGIYFNDVSSRLEIMLEEKDDLMRITRYSQTHLDHIEKLRDKMPLYSEKDAVDTLYINNKIPAKSKILWRQLFYKNILQVRGKNVYVPTWFIAIETGQNVQIEEVNAFSNRIITNNQLQKVENDH